MTDKKNILIIDDSKEILYTLEQICKFEGWNPLLAEGYPKAKQLIDNHEINLCLVDYHMPEVNGVTAVREIRKKLPKTPIIVLTIEEDKQVVDAFMEAGANDYSIKPVKAIDLISRIKVHLQYHERNQYYENHDKGISRVTLEKVSTCLKKAKKYMTIEDIEEQTGIKKKTLYRYLQYMLKENWIECDFAYGDMGRPKTSYRTKS